MKSRKPQNMGETGAKLAPQSEVASNDDAIKDAEKAAIDAKKKAQMQAIKSALENPDYEWRTIQGIANDTKLDPTAVNILLHEMSPIVIRSSIPDKNGYALYTTREHYRRHKSPWDRILTAVSDVVK